MRPHRVSSGSRRHSPVRTGIAALLLLAAPAQGLAICCMAGHTAHRNGTPAFAAHADHSALPRTETDRFALGSPSGDGCVSASVEAAVRAERPPRLDVYAYGPAFTFSGALLAEPRWEARPGRLGRRASPGRSDRFLPLRI